MYFGFIHVLYGFTEWRQHSGRSWEKTFWGSAILSGWCIGVKAGGWGYSEKLKKGKSLLGISSGSKFGPLQAGDDVDDLEQQT